MQELGKIGHRGFAFDLPGHGDDPTPRSAVTFQSYVAAATRFLQTKGPDTCVLVGHSIAGMILPEIVLENISRISQVVFLAALVLDAGEAAIDVIPESRRSRYFEMARQSSDNTLSVDFDTAFDRFFNDLREHRARMLYGRLTPQPFAPYLEPLKTSAHAISKTKRYIICSRDRTFPRDLCLGFASKLGTEPEEIDAAHDVMLSRPVELAQLLTKSAGAET